MAEALNLQINIGGNAFKNLGEVKKALKEANAELIAAQTTFGEYSKEAVAAAKKVALFKDAIQEASETANLFDPGKKFQALSGALTAVAGGFTAVQGAIGLFGVESKEVEKQLLRVQSALALSQGLSTITDSVKDFQRLAAVIKTQVVTAFSTLRGAIAATGLGLLAIAIPLIIQNFDKLKEALYRLIPALKPVGDFLGKIIDKASKFLGFKDEEVKKVEKTNKKVVDAELEKNKKLEAERKRALERKEKEDKRIAELDAKAAAARIRLINDEITRKEELRKKEEEETKRRKKQDEDAENNVISIIDRAKRTVAGVNEQNQKLLEQDKAIKRAQIEAEYALQDAKFQAASAGLSLLGTLVSKNEKLQNALFVADRALAIAKIIIDTQREIAGYAAANAPLGPAGLAITATMAGAAKIRAAASIATIAATTIAKFKGGGTNAGSNFGPSIPTLGAQSPIQPQASLTQLNQQMINAIGNQAIRAYVVETDITTNQKRIEAIKNKAKFG